MIKINKSVLMKDFLLKNEKIKVIFFFAILTAILTWPVLAHFLSAVPSSGSDTMQVIGTAGLQANKLHDLGIFRGTLDLAKHSSLNIETLYAYFHLIFGRVFGYNLLFYLSFILSGFGAYLLADYFVKNKKAALLAGIIFAFSPFHMHNALSTNVGTMHQEWLPFFILYLFRFFEKFEFKYFLATAAFLFLIGVTEHQMLAFTAVFILFFLVYKLIAEPKKFLDKKLWIYFLAAALFFSIVFFFIFRNLIAIANSSNNFLDAGLGSAVRYSNDSLSIFATPAFHSLWPNAFVNLREQFRRSASSDFSAYAGYSTLLLSLLGIVFWKYMKKRGQAVKSIFFWLAIALGFYVLSWGPYLHYKGVLDPPVKMPYYLIYQYLPFYKNIRTVGRLFIYSILAFSVLAAWGMAYLEFQIKNKSETENRRRYRRSIILYSVVGLIIILEFLAVPLETNSLSHSPFYERLGQDKGNYSVLEIPGSTSYSFASRDLVWESIHRKAVINGYDFARVNEQSSSFQRGTPIIRTLLYGVGKDQNDADIMGSSYHNISNEILNYYNIHYIVLDRESLRGDPSKNEADDYYSARSDIQNLVNCSSSYEDSYLYACEVAPSGNQNDMFFAMDFSNSHWVGKYIGKSEIQRAAESGAEIKLVNMSSGVQSGKISLSVNIPKPLNVQVLFNGQSIYQQYLTQLTGQIDITTNEVSVNPGQNDVIFEIRGADGTEIHADNKTGGVSIYNVDIK
jgi:hypothetical protein